MLEARRYGTQHTGFTVLDSLSDSTAQRFFPGQKVPFLAPFDAAFSRLLHPVSEPQCLGIKKE
jgi:hypothetical protein